MSKNITPTFEVIPDNERPADKWSNTRSPLTIALCDGKTVFVPGATHKFAGGVRTSLARWGFRIVGRQTVRDGVFGLVMWAEKKESQS